MSVLERDACITERCLYLRDVCTGEMSVLEREVGIKDVGITEISVLE